MILNNIPSTPDSIPEDRVLQFVEGGGGLFSIHDTVFPYSPHRKLIAACGIRAAFDAVQPVQRPNGVVNQILLARANRDDPMQYFPVRAMAEGAGHPIMVGVREFEDGDSGSLVTIIPIKISGIYRQASSAEFRHKRVAHKWSATPVLTLHRITGGGIASHISVSCGVHCDRPLEAITPEHFHKQFDLNVLGVLLTTQDDQSRQVGPM